MIRNIIKCLVMLLVSMLIHLHANSQNLWLDVNFDGYNGMSATVPTGIYISWNSASPASFYSSAGNFGLSAPSYKFGNDSDYISTYNIVGIDSICFWMKGNGSPFSTLNELRFYYSQDSVNYTQFASIDSLPSSGTNFTLAVAPQIYGFIKIEYAKAPAGGNLAFDDLKIYSPFSVGVGDEIKSEPISVFPTPTNGLINIKTAVTSELPRVEMFDLLGNKIAISTPERKAPGHFTLDISNRNKGFYFLKIRSGTQFTTSRITLVD